MPDIEEQENAGESTLTIGVPGGLAGALTNFGYQPDAADPLGQQLLQIGSISPADTLSGQDVLLALGSRPVAPGVQQCFRHEQGPPCVL